MRDRADNVVIVCSIENLDPMGVHTGDSITVAPGADPDRQGIPAHAGRGHRVHPRDRRGDRRVEHPVRREPGQRPHGRHRDEPAGVPLLRAGLQGHGIPHRQDRGQARRRLHPGRDSQRHHPKHPGLLRAVHRLLRGEDPAVRLREVPGRRPDAHHPDEVRGRGDGHRPHLQGGAPEGHPRAGDQARRAGRERRAPVARASLEELLGRPNAERLFYIYEALHAGGPWSGSTS